MFIIIIASTDLQRAAEAEFSFMHVVISFLNTRQTYQQFPITSPADLVDDSHNPRIPLLLRLKSLPGLISSRSGGVVMEA